MRTPVVALFLAALAVPLPGCKSEGQPPGSAAPPRPQFLADIPRLDRSILTDTTGAEDAERFTYVVQVPLDSVARFYRAQLAQLGWRIVGDMGDSAQVSLYATKGGPALWVQVRALGNLATEYTLIAGAGGGEVGRPAPAPGR